MNYGHLNAPLLETLEIISPEPVSLEEAKLHLRETETVQDELIRALISAAREHVESVTGRALVRARKRIKLWDFVDKLRLRPIPVVEIEAYEFLSIDASPEQFVTIDPSIYELQTSDDAAMVYLRVEREWPTGLSDENYPVRVTYVTGPALVGSPGVPRIAPALKQAILILVADMYENREVQMSNMSLVTNKTFDRLVMTHKLWEP